MINGKLIEMGKQPQSVRVIIKETPCTEIIIHLTDSEGVITQSNPTICKRGTSTASKIEQLNEARKQLEEVSVIAGYPADSPGTGRGASHSHTQSRGHGGQIDAPFSFPIRG